MYCFILIGGPVVYFKIDGLKVYASVYWKVQVEHGSGSAGMDRVNTEGLNLKQLNAGTKQVRPCTRLAGTDWNMNVRIGLTC